MRYEEFSPATARLTRSLKAVDEPRTIRERRMQIDMVKRMDLIGRALRGST